MRMKAVFRLLLGITLPAALLIFAFLFVVAGSPADAVAAAAAPPLIELEQQSAAGLSFTLNTAVFTTSPTGDIQVEGLTTTLQTPGAPRLPYYTALIAIPPEATVQIHVSAAKEIARTVGQLPAANELELSFNNEAENPLFPATVRTAVTATPPDPAIFTQDSLYPTAVYELSAPLYYRDLRLVQLKLYPFRYNPVRGQLQQSQQLHVNLVFEGAELGGERPLPTPNDAYVNGITNLLLNPDQAQQWRSLPTPAARPDTVNLPIGQPTLKIEVARDGIYEISHADLQQAGLLPLNPNTIQMMHRGETVAYQFIGNTDNTFDSDELIRFYGTAVNESRYEKQLARFNVYWLWGNGVPTRITTTTNLAGTSLPVKTNYLASITREDEKFFFSTWTHSWEQFPNEPDSWYWRRMTKSVTTPVQVTEQIVLPDPVLDPAMPDAHYTIELLSREDRKSPKSIVYTFSGCLNSTADCGQAIWGLPGDPYRARSINITNTVPITTLVTGTNNVLIIDETTLSGQSSDVLLNRVTVEYMRHLIALDNQLIFADEVGSSELRVQGFSENDPANVLVWNVADPHQPVAITMASSHIEGSNPYTYTFATNHPADTPFVAANTASILSGAGVITFSQYIPANIHPSGGAEWVAISHSNFIAAANSLAQHRGSANFGGLTTHVVDVADVINQYGFGMPFPAAIRDYLQAALATWNTPPAYVVLVGDGLVSPRNLPCATLCPTSWDASAVSYVPTDLMFVDRFQGLIPSDLPMALLVGDDLLPDIGIGRIPATTLAQAQAAVEKIIRYEQNQLEPADWQKRIMFVADDADDGGDFCAANLNQTGPLVPASFEQIHLCLEEATEPAAQALRDAMQEEMLSQNGISILNYRGHGAVQYWGGAPRILSVEPASAANPLGDMTETFWTNNPKPVAVISADCLDGHFAIPGWTALSERFFTFDGLRGSAAHWSSSGLGYDTEHTILLNGFFTGLFTQGLTAFGDAENYAKVVFFNHPYYFASELFSFNLQGDPAMQLYRTDVSLTKTAVTPAVVVGETAVFNLEFRNDGIFPIYPTIVDTLPDGLSYLSSTGNISYTTAVTGNQVTFTAQSSLAEGESAMITVNATAVAVQGEATNVAVLNVAGFDLHPGDEMDSATIIIANAFHSLYLPSIKK